MDYRNGLLLSVAAFVFLALSMPVPAFASECDVEVYGLNVEDSKIVGYVRNIGDGPEVIRYTFYVNDNKVRTLSWSEKRRWKRG